MLQFHTPAWFLLLSLCVSGAASAATPHARSNPSHQLHLCAERVDTSTPSAPLHETLAQQPASRWRVVQLDRPMTPKLRTRIEATGLRINGCLPPNAFVVDCTNAKPADVAKLQCIRWHSTIKSAWKCSPELRTRSFSCARRQDLHERGNATLLLTLHKRCDTAAILQAIRAMPNTRHLATGRIGAHCTLRINAPLAAADRIAAIEEVCFVEHAPEPTLRNSTVQWIVQSNVANSSPLHDHGLHGEGETIGVIDGGLDPNHHSFYDADHAFGNMHRKIAAYNATVQSGLGNGHGTHVIGTIAGDAGLANDTRGIAYNAKIAFNVVPLLDGVSGDDDEAFDDLTARFQQHHDQGARIHSNSWGDDGSTAYGAWTRVVDAFSYDNEEDLIVFAVTNGTLIQTPENAKHCLAVAASGDTPNQHAHGHGGAGPTADGRRKPEILAPGVGILSAKEGTTTSVRARSGTSFAAPSVSAVAALVRQYFLDGLYPTGAATGANSLTPSGALLRATLINGAADMTGIAGYPSNQEGWGRLQADNALHFAGEMRTLFVHDVRNTSNNALDTDDLWSTTLDVESTTEPLRITMVFTDPPAAPGAAVASVNDLSLEVVDPNGTVYAGNDFADGHSAPANEIPDFDTVNTVEQVLLPSPAIGTWTIRVRATAVNEDTQGFALVATGAIATTNSCLADLTGDEFVDAADLANLLNSWGVAENPTPADLNHSGQVDAEDLANLLNNWGECPTQ